MKEITFFRRCRSSEGNAYEAPLWSVRIPLSVSEDRALAFAREEFAKWAHIAKWSKFAQFHRISAA